MRKTTEPKHVLYQIKDVEICIRGKLIDAKDIEFRIEKAMNTHDILHFTCTVDVVDIKRYIANAYDENSMIEIKLVRYVEDKRKDIKRVFFGMIETLKVYRTVGERVTLVLVSYAPTMLMDKIKKVRSYQDPNLTYKAVIEDVMKAYKSVYAKTKTKDFEDFNGIEYQIDRKLDTPINHVLFQTLETDWEFLLRICSQIGETGIPVVPHLQQLFFGFFDLTSFKTNVKYAQYARGREGKNIVFSISGTDPYNPMENIHLIDPYMNQEGDKIVSQSHIMTKNGYIHCDFDLIDEDYIFPFIQHEQVKGLSIEARVIEVGVRDEIAVVTLDFTEGIKRFEDRITQVYPDAYAGLFAYPYTTMYSQSNTGFFVTPEKNDLVSVYFPTTNESMAYVQGAVNNPGNGRASNPNVRNFASQNSSDPKHKNQPMFNFTLTNEVFAVDVTKLINLTSGNTMMLNGKNLINLSSTSGSIESQALNSIESTSKSNTLVLNVDGISINSPNKLQMMGFQETLVGGGLKTEVNAALLKLN